MTVLATVRSGCETPCPPCSASPGSRGRRSTRTLSRLRAAGEVDQLGGDVYVKPGAVDPALALGCQRVSVPTVKSVGLIGDASECARMCRARAGVGQWVVCGQSGDRD